MSTPILKVSHLYFSYGNQKVLDDVSLSLEEGEFLGILGPNGSGKSTLMKIVLGLMTPQQGEIDLFGSSIAHFKERSRIGYVSQKANSFNLGFPATVREVVASGLTGKLGLFKRYKKSDWQRVDEVIEQVELSHLANRNIGKLSGGQQQRAFIARALVGNPELLILDEPTVGVDAKSTTQFYELVRFLHQNQGLSVIMVTHDIGVISSYVDRVACLNKRLFFHGEAAEFQRRQKEILSAAYDYDIQLVEHHHH
ncbi:zinc transport system ATP-binding protein [Thermoactinomyces sp. DSM 45891]|uniref:metal ABC transporter ATP-binding protein n=1 Tax=Thermoactinomyces sp. DSM 45891 TaxID=1761907 RepID=UPI0009177019|nr:metal ABC transporter ATP-binding protein [Thermoactinomyces sp. DSM 45891]SFX31772.1 zinc transport system ATP-binding protein [Thermoactinomyces sp. DSM 45891]